MKVFAGIDYSMSCPAVAVYSDDKPFSFENCKFLAMPTNKKLDPEYDNVRIIQNPGTDIHQMERFETLASTCVDFLLEHNVTDVALEGYSYGSSAGQVFNIGENGGILKHRMWINGIDVKLVPPTTLKKFSSGKGNSNKQAMLDQFIEDETFDLHDFFKMKHLKSIRAPITDIVDAFYLAKWASINIT